MRRPPSLLGAFTFVVALAVVAPGWGCIAFIHDDEGSYSTTCHFEGEDSACGQCVQTSCSEDLGDCCADDSCASSLTLLDSCAGTADAAACTSLANASGDSIGAFEEMGLGACIEEYCAMCGTSTSSGGDGGVKDAGKSDVDVTGTTNPGPQPSCSEYTSGEGCSCSVVAKGAATIECNIDAVRDGLCCADLSWPSTLGSTCSCKPFRCVDDGSGFVDCTLSDGSSPGTTVYPPEGTVPNPDLVCCASQSECTCTEDGADCESLGEDAVEECSYGEISCPPGTQNVAACTL